MPGTSADVPGFVFLRKEFIQKIRPGHLAVNGALKTIFVFYCGKIPAKQVLCSRRSKVSATQTLYS